MKMKVKTTTGETMIETEQICAVTCCQVWSTDFEMMVEEYHIHLKSGTIFVTTDSVMKMSGGWA